MMMKFEQKYDKSLIILGKGICLSRERGGGARKEAFLWPTLASKRVLKRKVQSRGGQKKTRLRIMAICCNRLIPTRLLLLSTVNATAFVLAVGLTACYNLTDTGSLALALHSSSQPLSFEKNPWRSRTTRKRCHSSPNRLLLLTHTV